MEQVLLTPEETAELLRLEPSDAITLVEDGSLAGFQVCGQWRITFESIKEFVSQNLRRQNLKAVGRKLQSHGAWAKALQESPALAHQIRSGKFEPGTMGAFLQEVLGYSEGGASGNVIPFLGSGNDAS